MNQLISMDDLLVECLHDLKGAEAQAGSRLPKISALAIDPVLRRTVFEVGLYARGTCSMLDGWANELSSEKSSSHNLWMKGILDDAERDTVMIDPGSLLDIAMIGAVRKSLAASIVSYETAIAVAHRCNQHAIAGGLSAIMNDKQKHDRKLRDLLRGESEIPRTRHGLQMSSVS